jgi:quinohemoprotein amine dehydrogenase beta subunit
MSVDGKQIYTHQNPVILHSDHYEIQPARVAIFDTAAGLDVPPVKILPAPRQVTIMGAGADGTIYLGGRDVYAMNPETGDVEIAIASASLNDPNFALRDVLTIWNIGADSGEFYRMYSSAEYADDSQNLETARWHWGYERVDLTTGETQSREFGPLEEVLFSSIRRPGHPHQVYAVLNNLVKFDASELRILDSQSLNHSYYCINFTPDGSRVVLAGAANEVAVHDAETLEKLGSVMMPGDMSMSSTQLFRAVSPGT